MGIGEVTPITQPETDNAKNGPGVALNRPQDTERYNAKDSIVRRAVKCSCLCSKTKWATLGTPSSPFYSGRFSSSFPFVTSSPSRQFEGGGGRGSSLELRKLREEQPILSVRRNVGADNGCENTSNSINNYNFFTNFDRASDSIVIQDDFS